MTETSPLAAIAHPPAGADLDDWNWRIARPAASSPRSSAGSRPTTGRSCRTTAKSVGEFEVRGPWVTGSYYQGDDPSKFSDDGWLRTGDVGFLDDMGFMQISDRSKDVIKSGGEWISSVDLENALMGHPDVLEAAVVAVPDDRWSERPLANVVDPRGRQGRRRGAARVPRQVGREVAAARALGVHRGGAEDVGRQVRQEGPAREVRRRRPRGRRAAGPGEVGARLLRSGRWRSDRSAADYGRARDAVRLGRGPLRRRVDGAAGGPAPSALGRRGHRAARPARPGRPAAPARRGGRQPVDHAGRPARQRQDDHRPPARQRSPLPRAVGGERRRQGGPRRHRGGAPGAGRGSANAPSCSSTRCTASPRRSRTSCCRPSRTAGSSSSPPPPRTRSSRSSRRCCRARCCCGSSR